MYRPTPPSGRSPEVLKLRLAGKREGTTKGHRTANDLFTGRDRQIRTAGPSIFRECSRKCPKKRAAGTDVEVLTEEEMREREKANLRAALQQIDWKIYGPGALPNSLESDPLPSCPASRRWK